MAATATSFPGVQRNLKEFLRVLKYAACEWILIFLLFVDAAFSYMLTSFARYCELQIPCILCSRLDHVFGNVKDRYYRTLFCRDHRSELSFLFSCNVHDKLVDGRGMCEDCLSSYIEGLKSNSDMQRLFAGELEYDGNCSSQSSVLDRVIRLCLCCEKPWASRPGSNRLLLLKSNGVAEANRNNPLPRTLSLNDLKKMRDMCSVTSVSAPSHVGDTLLNITSDSKSGFRPADNRDANGVVCDINENEPKKQLNTNESLDDYPSSSGLMDVPRSSASLLADHNSRVDTSSSVNAKDVPLEQFSDNCASASRKTENISINNNDEIMKVINRSGAPEFVTKYMLAYTNGAKGDLKSSPATKSEHISLNKNDEISKTRTGLETDRVVDDTNIVNSSDGDPSAVQTLPVNVEEKSASEFDANVVNEDLKAMPAQNSSGEGNQLSLNYLSPELQDRAVELLRTDSNSAEVRNLKNLFIEAISEPPSLKPFDESSDIEGESLVDRLNRQIENAREHINELSKDLEEERNASAIAAIQAMAMITRLQEEKAALRMEALQYLRMMEEQAEYDIDALEKANDLLIEKEKELQDLEAELEYYRLNFPDQIPEETEPGANINLNNKEHVSTVNTTTTCSKQDDIENSSETESPEAIICTNNIINTSETEFPEACVVDDQPVVITAWSEIEDEKLFISHLLQKLEKKLNRLAQHGATQDNSDSEHSDYEKDHKREHEASSMANGTGPCQESSSTSTSKDDDGEDCRENGLEALENEISELNERLEALETDCSFLQRSLNSLENGKEGLVLIQEILHLLREVKKIGLKTMNPSVL
ncbi:hypothetical protein HRI_000600800 [Hibiscus trionum]|uniref:GTD-binding domain-containing protein n=1 Tax=Hibiscus trionum TaxID=183268 RepID=A0A9W7H1F0_HIBTR|nr:hypothetical protein HRI_000600800 [Hibiscus trionum]